MRGIFEALERMIRRGRTRWMYGPSVEFLVSRGVTASDLKQMSSNVEKDLKSRRISVVDPPDREIRYQIDESELGKILRGNVSYGASDRALDKDVQSLAAIAQLRKGRQFSDIENCVAVFVTTNNGLARGSRHFYIQEFSPKGVNLCYTDFYLANLLWLKKPTKAPNLPMKRIIADAYAATQPDNQLWRKYTDMIGKLEQSARITSDDYYLLRHGIGARAALMELTLGEEQAVTEGTVPEILAVIEERRRDESRAELAEERARREAAEARELARSQRLRGRAEGIASVAARAIAYVTLGVVILGLAWGLIGEFGGGWAEAVKLTFGACALALAALTIGHIMKGITVEDRIRELEVWLADRVEVWLRRASGG